MAGNLDIWNSLGRTDPEQTKAFTRGGGFRGTAIKPVYTEMKMTEQFGPCGIGWGFTDPVFKTFELDGEIIVYCWLSLWYELGGKRSELIPGVGGDFVVKKTKNGSQADDEAFKKAFTDAIGNAMKHIGMSADVHMGRFDDSKYVSETRQEIKREQTGKSSPTELNKAAEYVDWAKGIIAKVGTREDCAAWWKDQAAYRKAAGLTQAHVDELKAAMLARFPSERKEAA